MTTARALIQMTAHRGGAALLDGYQDFKMHPGEPRGRPFYELGGRRRDPMISANSRSGPFIHFFREPFFRFGAAARVSESMRASKSAFRDAARTGAV